MESYVLGFMFSPALDKVVLIDKKKPEWQAGKLNGVGGKIEDEYPSQAMVREFEEETGVTTDIKTWTYVATARYDGGVVFVYACRHNSFCRVKSKTTERVGVYPVSFLGEAPVIENLRWLVPICSAFLNLPVHNQTDLPLTLYL